MLRDNNANATVAVRDLARARKFYEGTLGLEVDVHSEEEGMGTLSCKSGDSEILVYESRFAGTNQATAVTWVVSEDVAEVVRSLKAKGVTFEHYDFPDTEREGDVHVGNGVRVAWFKDPDGNILSVVNA